MLLLLCQRLELLGRLSCLLLLPFVVVSLGILVWGRGEARGKFTVPFPAAFGASDAFGALPVAAAAPPAFGAGQPGRSACRCLN
jgi:hypothetical protein